MGEDGRKSCIWAFAMILSWSRACYVGLVRRADTAAFIQCHAEAFEYLGVRARRRLYDYAKAVSMGRGEDGQVEWNLWMLNVSLRVRFEMWLGRPHRSQTKGKVEAGSSTSRATCGRAFVSPVMLT